MAVGRYFSTLPHQSQRQNMLFKIPEYMVFWGHRNSLIYYTKKIVVLILSWLLNNLANGMHGSKKVFLSRYGIKRMIAKIPCQFYHFFKKRKELILEMKWVQSFTHRDPQANQKGLYFLLKV